MIKKVAVWCALLVCMATPVLADDQMPKEWMIGTELDLVPYIYDGYYLSAVAGSGNWRVRYVRTKITTPDFTTQSGFEDNKLNVDAYIVDYYFKEGFAGWWLGPGYETWDGRVREKSSGVMKGYKTEILTVGGGYTYRFNNYLYINPWAAMHIPIGGDTDMQFVNSTFKVRATPEVSIKIGINF